MGETSAELERELVGVRAEITATVDELERRTRQVVDLREQARDRPALVGLTGLLILGGVSLLSVRFVAKQREARRPINRWRRRAYSWLDDLGQRVDESLEALAAARNRDARGRVKVRQQPSMVKKLLWMGLTAGTLALAGILARRVCSVVWEKVMHEPPPTAKV